MQTKSIKTRDDFLDALYDLKHNLGKYIRLPVAMLEQNAKQDDLKDALCIALTKTREHSGVTRGAREIWGEFVDEWRGFAHSTVGFFQLESCFERVMEWEKTLEADSLVTLEKGILDRDLSLVGEKIQSLIDEVEGG